MFSESGEFLQSFFKTFKCIFPWIMKPYFAERVCIKGNKRRALKEFPAALFELAKWLNNGREHLSGPDAIIPHLEHRDQSSDVQRKPGTLVKSPHRILAMKQTGPQAVDS